MNPLNIATSLLDAFRAQRTQEVQEEASGAAELVAQMVALSEHDGFKRLLDELAPAHDLIYDRWLSGQPVAPEQQAFARLVRLLRSRPVALVEMARTILADARRV